MKPKSMGKVRPTLDLNALEQAKRAFDSDDDIGTTSVLCQSQSSSFHPRGGTVWTWRCPW